MWRLCILPRIHQISCKVKFSGNLSVFGLGNPFPESGSSVFPFTFFLYFLQLHCCDHGCSWQDLGYVFSSPNTLWEAALGGCWSWVGPDFSVGLLRHCLHYCWWRKSSHLTLCFKVKFQALVLCFLFLKLSSRLSVSMACVWSKDGGLSNHSLKIDIWNSLAFSFIFFLCEAAFTENPHWKSHIKSLTVGSSRVTFSNFLPLFLSSSLFLSLSLPSSYSFCDNREGLWSQQCFENLGRML